MMHWREWAAYPVHQRQMDPETAAWRAAQWAAIRAEYPWWERPLAWLAARYSERSDRA